MNILEKIIEEKKKSLALLKKEISLETLEKNIKRQSLLDFKETPKVTDAAWPIPPTI